MDRIVVIANPSASQFTGGAHRDVMSALTQTATAEALWPTSARDASRLAAEAAAGGAHTVVAMGGDGMVHHVAQGVVGTAARLGIVPVGTTNVFARLLAIPQRPVRAAEMLVSDEGEDRVLGTVEMQLRRGELSTTHHSLFACGLGLDAAIVAAADADPYRKYRFGSLHYARTAVRVALRDQPKRKETIEVTSGDREATASALLLQFRNVYSYFGPVGLQLSAESPDPVTAVLIETLKRRRIPQLAVTALRRRELDSIKDITTWHGVEHMEVVAKPHIACQADGESLGVAESATIDWVPASLRVAVPQSR